MMDNYGSITIDNKNLLEDLLGLEDDYESELKRQRKQQKQSINNQPQIQSGFYLNNFANDYSTQAPQGSNLAYEESPALKADDDIYRYVHSRISMVDHPIGANNSNVNDSLENNNNDNNIIEDRTFSNNFATQNQRIGSNKLLSDLAVASLAKKDYSSNINLQQNKFRPSLEEQLYETNLNDSLDIQQNNLLGARNNNNGPLFTTNPNQQFNSNTNLNQVLYSNNNINNNQPLYFDSQPSQYHHQQQQQQQQQPVLQPSPTHFQQQIIPYQNIQPAPLFVIPSPTGNPLPLINSSYQAPQFIPIPIQQTPNMYYQEPLFYNQAYPINFPGALPNNYFNPIGNDYNDPYQQNQYQQDLYNNRQPIPPPQPQPQQSQSQQYQNNNPNANNNGFHSSGSKFETQPLQPPAPVPRSNNYSKQMSHQSNESYEDESYTGEEFNNDFNGLKLNDKRNTNNEDELKQQEVWNKLKEKHSGNIGKKKAPNGLPPVANKTSSNKKANGERKPESNYLEKNIEALRNKENLIHRYPEKKYENVHGKNISNRVKLIQQTSPKKHSPMQNEQDQDYEENSNQKFLTMNLSNDYMSNKKISIPIDANTFKDKDHINVDINLRLLDLMPPNRSYDDFDVQNDPLGAHIRKFETHFSRSLPGSSGSLNKYKTLPPLNRAGKIKPFSQQDSRDLLHIEYDNRIRSEDGYLAQLQKASFPRPNFKTYSLKDYRTFKKDAIPNTNKTTGKLGFDYESDSYRQKMEVSQKKNDYALRVKQRNQIILAEQKKNELDSIKTNSEQEPSKLQRAKEYAKTYFQQQHQQRPSSSSRTPPDDHASNVPSNKTSNGSVTRPLGSTQNIVEKNNILPSVKSPNKPAALKYQAQSSQPPATTQSNSSKPKSREAKYDDNTTSVVRIRDPVTNKVKTIYLNDKQIDELSKRHQEDKNKVNNVVNSRSTKANNSPLIEKPKVPVDFNKDIDAFESSTNENRNMGIDSQRSNRNSKPLPNSDADDENFQKLLERHKEDKKKIDDFTDSPYANDNLRINSKQNDENQIHDE